MSESESSTQASETATPAAPKAPTVVERRVYVNHKQHGTCISFKSKVYLAPEGVTFDPKSAPRLNFTVGEGVLTDAEGRAWLEAGENPGCGPRCPLAMRSAYGDIWNSLSHSDRRELIALNTATKPAEQPAPAAAEGEKAE